MGQEMGRKRESVGGGICGKNTFSACGRIAAAATSKQYLYGSANNGLPAQVDRGRAIGAVDSWDWVKKRGNLRRFELVHAVRTLRGGNNGQGFYGSDHQCKLFSNV